jgi:ribosomal protein L37AE/L43A
MPGVNGKTRAPKHGRVIVCPECDAESRVYHFAWSALTCTKCEADVAKNDWETTDGF